MSDIGAHAPHIGNKYSREQPYALSPEEKRVMIECRSESFWYRAVPFSVGAGLLTKLMLNRGILTAGGTRFGGVPKVAFAAVFGYIIGRASYINKCKEKMMKLENSKFADALRKGRMPTARSSQPSPASTPQPTFSTDFRESEEFGGLRVSDDAHINLDIDTSNVKTVDDYQIQPELEDVVKEQPKMTTTYEELRNKNRSTRPMYPSTFAQPQQPPQGIYRPGYLEDQQQISSDDPSKQYLQDEKEFPLGRSTKKNKYGDAWE